MPSLVEISTVVLEEQILTFVNVFLPFRNYLYLEKGVALHSNKIESPLPKDALCQVLVEIDVVVLKKKMKMWTLYRQTDGRQAIRKAHIIVLLRWAKNYIDIKTDKQTTDNRQKGELISLLPEWQMIPLPNTNLQV